MQATVASFDTESLAGTVVTDDGRTLAFTASALADHVRHLRLGQRVFLDGSDDRIDGVRLDGVQPIDGGFRVVVEHDGLRAPYDVYVTPHRVDVESAAGHLALTRVPRFVDPAEQVHAGSLLAPMPGTVIGVHAESGATVEAGQPLLVLEAMKMQHTITAPGAGVLDVAVQVGQQVSAGDVLAVVTSDESSDEGAQEGAQG